MKHFRLWLGMERLCLVGLGKAGHGMAGIGKARIFLHNFNRPVGQRSKL